MIRYLQLCFLVVLFTVILPVKADDALLQQLIPSSKPQFLPVAQAFVISTQQTQNQLQITLQPAEGYYLYRDKIRVEMGGVAMPLTLPAGELHQDEYLGQTEIYPQAVTFSVTFNTIATGANVTLYYQGCTPGLCYPPQQQTIALSASVQLPPVVDSPESKLFMQPGLLALLSFFAMGVGLSLTPCVYPMYPVLSAMLTQHGQTLDWRRGLMLSVAYVFGMAITYTLLGLLIASAGAGIQGWLQNPWLLGLFSVFYLALALSLFFGNGLQLPRVWQDKLHYLANRQSLHSWHGVAMLGALSGLIGSPCTSAPLSGVLLFIAQSGNPLFGGSALFLLSLGMGLPLLILGAFGGQYLPKAGRWMVFVKQLFALLLLAMPLFLLERFIPVYLATQLWHWFLLGLMLWLVWRLWPTALAPHTRLIILLVLFAAGLFGLNHYNGQETPVLPFTKVNNQAELQQQLATAKAQGKPVMLDLYADWCVACRELDEKTFRDPNIQQSLRHYHLLRADVSANSQEHQALMQELQVLGLPNVLFFDAQSQPNPQLRLQGFVSANDLQGKLDQCQRNQHC
ncbi:MAG: protein-disulfide reductase DsbD [Tolumonas sp.]|nr:protein-disulfide reductase DsbD [Tolumonas sp.]